MTSSHRLAGGAPSLPSFDPLLDASAMARAFQARLPQFAEGKLRIVDCQVFSTRYKSYVRAESRQKSYLAIGYQITVDDAAAYRRGTQLLYAKAFVDGRSAAEYQNAKKSALAAPEFGVPLAHLPGLDMVVWAFPNDPELAQLPQAVDRSSARAYLPYENLPADINRSDDVTKVHVEVLHYYPEERVTARYRFRRSPLPASQSLSLIGKTFRAAEGWKACRSQQRLWEIAAQFDDKFFIARPLGFNPAVGTLWLEDLPGVPLLPLLCAEGQLEWLTKIACGLARLHDLPLVGSVRHRIADQLADLSNKTEKLCRAFPDLVSALPSLRDDLCQNAPTLAGDPLCFIHGDFHLRQLLAHDSRIGFLDFDECGWGDPYQDLASFLVDLYFYDFTAPVIAQLSNAFRQAYAAQSAPLDNKRLAWHMARQFLTKAYRVYRQHQADRRRRIHWLVGLARQCLNAGWSAAVARTEGCGS